MLSDIDKQDIDRKDTEHHHSIGEHICALQESKGWTQQTLGKKAFFYTLCPALLPGRFLYTRTLWQSTPVLCQICRNKE